MRNSKLQTPNSKFFIVCIPSALPCTIWFRALLRTSLFSVFCILLFYACATTPSVEDVKKAEAHYKLGSSYLAKEQLHKAFIEFQKAIKLNPNDKNSLNALGFISTEFKKYEEAINYYKRAVSADPNFSEAMNNLGATYGRIEEWDEAIKYFKVALKNPLYATPERAYSNMGYAFYKKGDYLNAVDTLKEAIARYPDFPRHFYILGLVYMKLNKNNAAIDEFKKAVDIAPEYIDAHWELANAYLRVGDKKEAVKHFKIVAESGNDERSKEALRYIDLFKDTSRQ